MIGEEEFRMMRPTGIFVNVSSGKLVDEGALSRAVLEGWIAGAGVDVFSAEPVKPDNPLLVAAREGAPIILTPHVGAATSEARARLVRESVDNALRVIEGSEPANVVRGGFAAQT